MSETDRRVLVLYDEDCGFCRWTLAWLLRWDRRALIAIASIQSKEGRLLLADLPPERQMTSWHAIDPQGTRESGGAAFPMTLRHLRGGVPLAWSAARWPRITEQAYQFVAERRAFWAKALSPRAITRANAVLAQRRGSVEFLSRLS